MTEERHFGYSDILEMDHVERIEQMKIILKRRQERNQQAQARSGRAH